MVILTMIFGAAIGWCAACTIIYGADKLKQGKGGKVDITFAIILFVLFIWFLIDK